MTNFIAIDGEGYDLPGSGNPAKHIYCLISCNKTDIAPLYSEMGLRTPDVVEWLFHVKHSYPDHVLISFYFSYDVNMMLGNISITHARKLGDYGSVTTWHKNIPGLGWRFEYMPTKFLTISKVTRVSDGHVKNLESLTVYDGFGFFQASFAKAIKALKVATPEEYEIIRSMKASRGEFKPSEIEEITRYNTLECELLVRMMNKLSDALETCGLYLNKWHGAGAITMAMYDKYDVLSHIGRPSADHVDPVNCAYFGGRIQAIELGVHKEVYSQDINSAYPFACLSLPSLKGAKQFYVRDYDLDKRNVVWHVRWNVPANTRICPFPFRYHDGEIGYPYEGEGYYWDVEVRAVMEHYAKYITVIEGYGFQVRDDTKPFSYINYLYQLRRQFKAEGNHAELPIKLGLNAGYGKLAQGEGYKGRTPKSQCFIWAGMITATTRSILFRTAMKDPSSVIAFATDCIMSKRRLIDDGGDNSEIGGWDIGIYRPLYIVKPGFYTGRKYEIGSDGQAVNGSGKSVRHTRGVRSSEVKFYQLNQVWRKDDICGTHMVLGKRFVGLKGCVGNDLTQAFRWWRRWVDITKTLKLDPGRGIPIMVSEGKPGRASGKGRPNYLILPVSEAYDEVVKDCPYCSNSPCVREDCTKEVIRRYNVSKPFDGKLLDDKEDEEVKLV